MAMRRPAGPYYTLFTRIGPEGEERRRRLQEQLDLSAGELVEKALRALDASVNGDFARQSPAA